MRMRPLLEKSIPFSLLPDPCYLVGGTVRDALVGCQTHKPRSTKQDLDLVVPAGAISLARKLADSLGAGFVVLDEVHHIARVVLDSGTTLDIAEQEGPSIEVDLGRRDFTCNAIAYDLQREVLIDPFNGKQDLEQRVVRMVQAKNLTEDPLRFLRAYRMAAKLEFTIESQTRQMLQASSGALGQAAPERVRDELVHLLEIPMGTKWFLAAHQDRVLQPWLPELADLEKIPANLHHHLPLLEHTFEVIRQVDQVLAELDLRNSLAHVLADRRTVYVTTKLGALLHDIAKPVTYSLDPDTGKSSFYQHEKVGSVMTKDMLTRLKFSREEIRWVTALVEMHLRTGQLVMQGASDRALYRLMRDAAEKLPALVVLSLADRRSTYGEAVTAEMQTQSTLFHQDLLARYWTPPAAKPFLSGKDLIEHLGLVPGPVFKEILQAVQEAQALGDVQNPEEALTLAQRLVVDKTSLLSLRGEGDGVTKSPLL
jgi:putative nucleotidyltransferase with HDIG domain